MGVLDGLQEKYKTYEEFEKFYILNRFNKNKKWKKAFDNLEYLLSKLFICDMMLYYKSLYEDLTDEEIKEMKGDECLEELSKFKCSEEENNETNASEQNNEDRKESDKPVDEVSNGH
jgi:hypothetical protein